MIALFSIIKHHSHRCFQNYIYILLTNFTTMILIPWQLRIFQRIFIPTSMETAEYWLMAWEYHIWNATIASLQFFGRRSWPNHPRHSFKMCLHHLLLDINQPHTMTAVWRSFIWMLCPCTECSIYPAVVFSRWRLWEWFQQWLINTFTKTPHLFHTSSMEHTSFNPVHTTLCHPADTSHYASPLTPLRPVCHCLTFTPDSSESEQDPDTAQTYSTYSDPEDSTSEYSDAEEDFQTVPMDDEHWKTEIAPERTFCIHENGLPNNVCQ